MAITDNDTQEARKNAKRLFNNGDYSLSKKLYTGILESQSNDQEALHMLGTIEQHESNHQKAIKYFRRLLEVYPDNYEACYQLGLSYFNKGQRNAAIECYSNSLRINPGFFDPCIALGNIYAYAGKLTQAITLYNRASSIKPSDPVPYSNAANVMADMGRLSEAADNWRKALAINPDYHEAHSNLILCLHYFPSTPIDDIRQENNAWYTQHAQQLDTMSPDINCEKGRRIKIGYVTQDFRDHSVAYFLKPLLENHNTREFEVFCFFDNQSEDNITEILKSLTEHPVKSHGLSDEQLACLIHDSKIDILVDLSGHTNGNRLLVFARKPAPLQISYLGYPDTTGVRTINYRLTDAIADPPAEAMSSESEELVRLPGNFLCYSPPTDAPDTSQSAFFDNGYITYGSFNYTGKTSETVISTWSDILKLTPDSKILLKYRTFEDHSVRERYIELFSKNGINRDRIIFMGLTPSKGLHMEAYNNIDIALDTFPYNGTTTTCDALWMGVPVVVLSGNIHASRVGASILSHLGLDELITNNKEEYIQTAVDLANNHSLLGDYHKRLRQMMRSSSLCDGRSFTAGLEMIYRSLWDKLCKKHIS